MQTTSPSGFHADISPESGVLQLKRSGKTSGVALERVAALLERHFALRTLGVFGELHINVLQLNLALALALAKEFLMQ